MNGAVDPGWCQHGNGLHCPIVTQNMSHHLNSTTSNLSQYDDDDDDDDYDDIDDDDDDDDVTTWEKVSKMTLPICQFCTRIRFDQEEVKLEIMINYSNLFVLHNVSF